MNLLRTLGIILNSITIISSLLSSVLLFFLAGIFFSSSYSSDRMFGYIMILIIIFILGLPAAGLFLSIKNYSNLATIIGFCLPIMPLILNVLGIFFLPGAIESSARP